MLMLRPPGHLTMIMLQEVGPEVMSTAPVLGVGEASLGVDQGLATFLMVLVACSLDHQVSP